ncbi:plexin-B-like [Penaeus japonicus]|uniref:plexin-B-like n=1 Tax=Penaeus japonicus TaxID=27405 RepID=UPI001C70FBB0|nr:plexin-B-like [Penaeus japonicus]
MCECGTPDDAPGPARRPARVDQQAGQSAGHTHTRTLMGTRCGQRARGVGVSVLVFLVLVFGACVTAGHRTHRASGGDSGADAAESEHPRVAQFWTGNQSLELQHMVYNRGAGVLYVGGTNRLWALGVDRLELWAKVETGPRFDSPRCHARGCGPERRVATVLTDNVNKVLVLDPEASTLIMCGSVSQGACEKFRTANISLTPEFLPRTVAANDPKSSTYAFVGPERYNPWGGSSALYVGTTFTTVGDYRHDVPAISTRNLYNLDYAEFSFSEQSLLRIDVKYRDHFLVQYVYGFNASDYAYFVTVQKKSHLPGQEESGYISRLARTCITDANYDSYTEITLECQGGDGTNYNLVQDAKLVSAGSDLAASMGVSVGDPILVGVFAPSQGHTAKPETLSAVCVYSVRDIEAKFNENIHMCFNGSMQYRSMEYISGPILDGKCPAAGTMGNIFNFCEVGLKISGVSPIHSRAALVYRNTSLSAVQAAITAHHTVLFLGTTTGSLKKALLAGPEDAAEYGEDVIDAGNRVLPDLILDEPGTHLFVLTTTRVSEVLSPAAPFFLPRQASFA